MLPPHPENSPKTLRLLLEQKIRLIIWGARHHLTFLEWQRQLEAAFLVDTKWERWKDKTFHGLSIYSPDKIAQLDSSKTLISNNFYNTRAAIEVENYLSSLGGYRAIPPLHLQEIVYRAKKCDREKILLNAKNNKLAKLVNKTLKELLISPFNLQEKRSPKKITELIKFLGTYTCDDYLKYAIPEHYEKNFAANKHRKRHACLTVSNLSFGGAERQLCNLAIGLKRAGWFPTVLVHDLDNKDAPYFIEFLKNNGVAIRTFHYPPTHDPIKNAQLALKDLSHATLMILWHLPPEFLLIIAQMYKALCDLKPELLISYLDTQNIYAGISGLMAGIPHICLSGRSINPTHFPQFYSTSYLTDFRKIYRLALSHSNVTLYNNSPAGAESYAKWLKIPTKCIPVVPNCITEEFTKTYSQSSIKAKRKELNLTSGQPFILGVFRLTDEKRPLDFIRVIAKLYKKYPNLRAAITGSGPEVSATTNLIKELKLELVVTLLGSTNEVPLLMKSATLLLHTAKFEGSPNVILEAQALGLPVVCTENSGSVYCLDKNWAPYMKRSGDIKGLAISCETLLNRPEQRKQLAKQARLGILRRLSIPHLTHNTLAVSGVKLKKPRIK